MVDLPIVFQSTLVLIKIGLVIGMLVYVGFAVVVLKQVLLMMQTLNVDLGKPLKAVAIVHLAVSIFIFIITVFV